MIRESKSIIIFKDPDNGREYEVDLDWDGTDLDCDTTVLKECEEGKPKDVAITEVALHSFIGALRDGSKGRW